MTALATFFQSLNNNQPLTEPEVRSTIRDLNKIELSAKIMIVACLQFAYMSRDYSLLVGFFGLIATMCNEVRIISTTSLDFLANCSIKKVNKKLKAYYCPLTIRSAMTNTYFLKHLPLLID